MLLTEVDDADAAGAAGALLKLSLGVILRSKVRKKRNGVLTSLPDIFGVAIQKLGVCESFHLGAVSNLFMRNAHIDYGLLGMRCGCTSHRHQKLFNKLFRNCSVRSQVSILLCSSRSDQCYKLIQYTTVVTDMGQTLEIQPILWYCHCAPPPRFILNSDVEKVSFNSRP